MREGEGVVAVRSKMDVALPNSAGLYLHCISCAKLFQTQYNVLSSHVISGVPEWAWLEGSGEETGRRGCGHCCRGHEGCGLIVHS